MNLRPESVAVFAVLALAGCVASEASVISSNTFPGQQTVFDLKGRLVVVRKIDALPFIENDYSRRFRFDAFSNPKLKQLREHYQLESVVAPGQTEFEKQVLLLHWVHERFKKFGKPSTNVMGALEILHALDQGNTFFCAQYAQLFVSAAASLGWVDRELALRRHQGTARDGSSEHSSTEIWSNQHRKWVMMDPTANMHVEKNGVPLSAFEIRQEWFYQKGSDLVFLIGKEQKRYVKQDLPIWLGNFQGFGDLTVPADELDKYGFTAFIPNTNLMDEREDYGRMFIIKDRLCDGTQWHRRDNPAQPAVEPYFPIGQAAVSLMVVEDKLKISLQTLTPNFKTYHARIDDGNWRNCPDSVLWSIHDGLNRLELRTENQFEVPGSVSILEVEAADASTPRAE